MWLTPCRKSEQELKQDVNLEAGAEAGYGGHLQTPGSPAQGWHSHHRLDPHPSITNLIQCPTG